VHRQNDTPPSDTLDMTVDGNYALPVVRQNLAVATLRNVT